MRRARGVESSTSRRVNKEKAYNIIDIMQEVARAHDVSVAQIALAWLLRQDAVTSVIIGAR